MRGRIRARIWLVLTLLVAGLRLGGAHDHLCLDGFESHQSVHWFGADLLDEQHHDAASHHDGDLCVSIEVLIKSLGNGIDLPALLPPLLIALLAPDRILFRRQMILPLRPGVSRNRCQLPPSQAPPR